MLGGLGPALVLAAFTLTCIAPRIARSMCPPRIIAKLSALVKKLAPGRTVMVSLPALMRSASSLPATGYGPTPSTPFSLWSTTSTPSATKFGTRVGMPIPRFT